MATARMSDAQVIEAYCPHCGTMLDPDRRAIEARRAHIRDCSKACQAGLTRDSSVEYDVPMTTLTTDTTTLDTLTQRFRALLAERPVDKTQALRDAANKARRLGTLTVPVITALINSLLQVPAVLGVVAEAPVAAPEAPKPEPKAPKANRFPGECIGCEGWVVAEEGIVAGKGADGKWLVAHLPGRCPTHGRYAVEVDGVLKFFVITKEGIFAQASDELHQLVHAAYIAQVLDLINEDRQGAYARYGQELGICGVCSRTLTDDVSRSRGIGPTCFKKFDI